MSLPTAVRMWHTPRANENGESSASFVKRNADRGEHCFSGLTAQARMFPTPTVQDSENDGGPSQYNRNSVPLNALVKMIPIPRATDGSNGGPNQSRNGKPDGLTAFAGGSLNPDWVEWLMGFPVGWTACGVSETRLSRKSSKLSVGQS